MMNPRRRWRTVAKWTSTAVCVLLALSMAFTLHWYAFWTNSTRTEQYGVGSGAFAVLVIAPSTASGPSTFPALPGLTLGTMEWADAMQNWRDYATLPTFSAVPGPPSYILGVPLWIPLLLTAIPAWLLWRADRRRRAPNDCQSCGYNLTGNTTGVCPECGTPTSPRR